MRKNISDQIGSALAHIQDLFDTIFHITFKRIKSTADKKPERRRIFKFFSSIGDSFYRTYTEIKQKKQTANNK
jgi:hypothetical protein